MTQETQSGDPTKDATKSYSYDAYGHRISLRNAPVAGTTKNHIYAYDVHGSVSLLTEVATATAEASYGYDAYGEKDSDLSVGDPEDNNPLNPYVPPPSAQTLCPSHSSNVTGFPPASA